MPESSTAMTTSEHSTGSVSLIVYPKNNMRFFKRQHTRLSTLSYDIWEEIDEGLGAETFSLSHFIPEKEDPSELTEMAVLSTPDTSVEGFKQYPISVTISLNS